MGAVHDYTFNFFTNWFCTNRFCTNRFGRHFLIFLILLIHRCIQNYRQIAKIYSIPSQYNCQNCQIMDSKTSTLSQSICSYAANLLPIHCQTIKLQKIIWKFLFHIKNIQGGDIFWTQLRSEFFRFLFLTFSRTSTFLMR